MNMDTHKGQYGKGQSGNLRGRPAEPKNAKAKLDKFIDRRTGGAYKHLSKALEENEPWATELVFKDLLPGSNTLRLEVDSHNPDKIDAMIEAILKAIREVEYLTVEESCHLLSSLAHLRKSEHSDNLPKFNQYS